MNPTSSRQVVIASIGTTAAVQLIASASRGHLPRARTVVGIGFAWLFLSVLSDLAPQVAGPMAVLVMLGALVLPADGVAGNPSSATIVLGAISGKGPSTVPPSQLPPFPPGVAGPPVPGQRRG